MAASLKGEVLRTFKRLHRVRQSVFKGDNFALNVTRNKINEEFKKNKHVSAVESIQELVKFSISVEEELRTRVVQAKEKDPGIYELQMRPDIRYENNAPFISGAASSSASAPQSTGCCQQQKSAPS
ncbi:complex III assembly factor LYRM7 [Nilaparvata lugens]|uniref:complex III assembly factor LYRM7 n=1 Tax=Nilaparvata lugens TaxID=108931 RepID=UPI000B98BA6F|nr:complex III assembly factor LYRM7 [Nilaparvata lugens]